MTDTYGPINIQSGKVTKPGGSTSGKTAHRAQWFNAPSDRYFVEGSWRIDMISALGKNAGISVSDVKRKEVEITLPNGSKVTHSFVVGLYVVAHAETSSDFALDAVTAWAEGELTAETQEFI